MKTDNNGHETFMKLKYSKALCFIGFGLAMALCLMPMLKAKNLHSAIYDLGNMDSFFWNSISNFNWSRFFFAHAWPAISIEAILYKFWPSAIFLVCLQSLLLIIGSFSLCYFPYNTSKSPPIVSLLAFFLYFPLWYVALFDFHIDHLTIPLLFLFYYGCFRKKWWLAVVSAMALAFVKEPFALTTAFCGIYLFVCCHRFKWGVVTFLFGGVYFYVATSILIPANTFEIRGGLDAEAFSWLGETPFEMIGFILTHPIAILMEIISNPGKMKYCLSLFGALAFIPFFKPSVLIPVIPIFGISLLSRIENYYGLGHHYTAGLIAPMIVAFALGYPKAENVFLTLAKNFIISEKARQIFVWGILGWMILVHILLSPSPISRLFLTNKVWNYGVEAYIPTDRETMIKEALKKFVPDDPRVPISCQNTLNWGAGAHRKYYFTFPVGVTEPVLRSDFAEKGSEGVWAEYVILDLKRPWFLLTQGCSWQVGESVYLSSEDVKRLGLKNNPGPLKWVNCASQEFRNEFIDTIVATKKMYRTIFEQDSFMILRRVVF